MEKRFVNIKTIPRTQKQHCIIPGLDSTLKCKCYSFAQSLQLITFKKNSLIRFVDIYEKRKFYKIFNVITHILAEKMSVFNYYHSSSCLFKKVVRVPKTYKVKVYKKITYVYFFEREAGGGGRVCVTIILMCQKRKSNFQ